ncbi:MAG TPA: hypothetical protein VG796_09595 [Verrucomicrobiales bacterium]|nr:hypothetical protein [Verrucomicrobiales bacterium]
MNATLRLFRRCLTALNTGKRRWWGAALVFAGLGGQAGAQTDLAWDSGTTNTGTAVYTPPGTAGGAYHFKIVTQASVAGGWRTALRVTAGEANLYIRQGAQAATDSFYRKSDLAGSDGFVLRTNEYSEGQDWYILVQAQAGAQWSLVSGEVYVQDLGALPYTDTNANNAYDIGEPAGAAGSGSVTIGAEGIRLFKATSPPGTPAWSLWLNGSAKDILVRKAQVPFEAVRDRSQSGRMLLVPPYLTGSTDTVFIGVEGAPGESINLDSRIQPVTDVAFGSTQTSVAISGAPFKLYRVTVPPEQLGWEVSVTPVSGDPGLAVREGNAAGEVDHTAYSNVAGNVTDSVTLVPPGLTDGAWYITVWSGGAATFTLKNGSPVVTPIAFTDVKVNDQTQRAGWRYYALTDIPSQLGKLGWQLQLTNHVPGTEIAIRRNALPGRWSTATGGSVDYVHATSTTGRLDDPVHQADVWYAGVYQPGAALGAFTLTTREITPAPVTFDGGSVAVSTAAGTQWQWYRVEVPVSATLKGWELKCTNVTSGSPAVVVRRGSLPADVGIIGFGFSASSWTTWPQGAAWTQQKDYANRGADPAGNPHIYRRLTMPMGRPLEAGTYFVGVTGLNDPAPVTCTLESRGIGTGFSIPITLLGDAATPSSANTGNLAARDVKYYRATVPAGRTSWQVTLTPTAGDMTLSARKDTIPAPDWFSAIDDLAGKLLQIPGKEQYVLLPKNGQDFLDPGDYYFAAASEGVDPGPAGSDRIGTGNAAGTLQNAGSLSLTDMGTATAAGVSVPVSLEPGQIKAYRVLAPAGVSALEARLDSRTGYPTVSIIPGTRLPAPMSGTSYGFDYGQATDFRSAILTTLPNPAAGEYRIIVHASYDGGYPPSTANLVVTARPPVNVTFNNGGSSVTNQQADSWRYFRVDVPAGVLGWEVRLTGISGRPQLSVRRDLLPAFHGTTNRWGPSYDTTWPSGNQTNQQVDYTWRGYEPDTADATYRTFVAAMGRPLEPGTYYVGVVANGDTAATYTLESRGIGTGQALPVTTVAFNGGSAVTPVLLARKTAFYKVTVPPNTPSWEVTLCNAGSGDSTLWVRQGTLPDPNQADALSSGGVKVQQLGSDRFVMLPLPGQSFLTAGDYYLAIVSEGTLAPNLNLIGTGDSSATLTSVGPLAVTNLGTATPAGISPSVNLAAGQMKALQITVPAGSTSLDVRLDTLTGMPMLSAVPGAGLPSAAGGGTGWNFGQTPLENTNEFHIVNPAAGVWSFLVRSGITQTETYPPATGTLNISIGAGPEPMTFNSGTSSVTNQSPGTWRFWQIEVPSGAAVKGWDLRIVNVTGGLPRMVVRREQVPESLIASGIPDNQSAWPAGASRAPYQDLTHRGREADGRDATGQVMVSAMGRPLEPGTYFVGVTSPLQSNDAMSYTLESRGIGTGQNFPITDLALNGSQPVSPTPARIARYFKTTIPAATPSWEITLNPTIGDLCLLVRAATLPDCETYNSVHNWGGRIQQKPGAERFVLLPPSGQNELPPGDYYIAAVSEGVNPGVPASDWIGTGSSAGTLTSSAPLAITNLGTATVAGLTQSLSLASGQYRAFQMSIPAAATAVEVRLDNRVGLPMVAVRSGTGLLLDQYYSAEGGVSAAAENPSIITMLNPAAGLWTLRTGTQAEGLSFSDIPPATAQIVVRLLQPQRLNFSSTENGNGFSHTETRSLLAGQKQFYSIPVPATVSGAEILGWMLSAPTSQGQVRMRVFESNDFTAEPSLTSYYGEAIVMAPPYFQPSKTWYLELEGVGATTYTLTSQPVTLQHAPYTMPVTPGQTFGDTGQGIGGDQGIDLANDAWHFYAFDVPAGNGGLLRAELQALNGNPDIYLRRGGIPTPHHDSNGPVWLGASLVDYSAIGNNTEYANWTPLSGRFEKELAPGRWYAGIRAAGNTNARYRLLLSTGSVQTLALNGGSVSGQNLAPRDVRYYKFAVPLDAPLEWKLTLTEQQGNVRAFIRDTIPPGREAAMGNDAGTLQDWAQDFKNHGPYPSLDLSGTYTLTTPPLRPGNTYYVGVQALDTAQFSLSSATAGGSVGTLPVLDFYTGQIDTTLAAGARGRWRIPAPADALRWKHTSTHDAGVHVLIEQGSLPPPADGHYTSSGQDSNFNRGFGVWPWVAGQDYYLVLANDTAASQHVVLTMDGRNPATEDENQDGVSDVWQQQYFPQGGYTATGDNDGDGLTNAVEYALGLNPTEGSGNKLPAPSYTTAGGSQRLALGIQLPDPVPPQARLEVLASDSLDGPATSVAVRPSGGNWSGNIIQVPGGVSAYDSQPVTTNRRRFLWLNVTLVPE